MHTGVLFVAAGCCVSGVAAQYTVATNFTSGDFFSDFSFFTGADPNGGFVNYLDQDTAQQSGLISQNAQGQIFIGVDNTTALTAGGVGRDSVRLTSNAAFNHYLTVIDLAHMPGSICGTWPAFWSLGLGGAGWPTQGEIDILEGANDQTADFMTLHTSPGCAISDAGAALLQPTSEDCDTAVDGNAGCSFHALDHASYGTGFNQQGGGIYAAEWNSTGIAIWYFQHVDAPADILSAAPDPATWGPPQAQWAGPACDWDAHFLDHSLVLDTTFCGSFGDGTFDSCAATTGAASCEDFVAANPAAFSDAYWLVNSLVVYQQP